MQKGNAPGKPVPIPAHAAFFPLGTLYAAIAVPLSVASMLGLVRALPGFATPMGHAHELLFGFGLAIVAGNQLGPVPRARLAVLCATWLAARLAFALAPGSLVAAVPNAAFAGLVALQLAPRVTARIRKLRNRALPVAVLALCATAGAMEAALHAGAVRAQHALLLGAVMLLALLMGFMGGRIIAPAAAGHLQRRGIVLEPRVQPRLEGVFVAAMFAALAALALDAPRACALALALAALASAIRLARWRPWRLRARDLLGLCAGYAWLVAGLAALAASLAAGARPVVAIHLITVGAMGTLTAQVMTLTWARLARRDPARLALPACAAALMAVAACARVAADLDGARRAEWLAVAALAWSAACGLVLVVFART